MSKVDLGGALPDNPAKSVVGLNITQNQQVGTYNTRILTTTSRIVIKITEKFPAYQGLHLGYFYDVVSLVVVGLWLKECFLMRCRYRQSNSYRPPPTIYPPTNTLQAL